MTDLDAALSHLTATYLDMYRAASSDEQKEIFKYSKILKSFIITINDALEMGNPSELTYEDLSADAGGVKDALGILPFMNNYLLAHEAALEHYAYLGLRECTKTIFRNEWLITPNSTTNVNTGEYYTFPDPIYRTIGGNKNSSSGRNKPRLCKPGDDLLVTPGDYGHFRVTHTYDTGGKTDKEITIYAQHPNTVFIHPNPVGGSHTNYLEWTGGFTFKNLTFIGDDTAAVMTENPYSSRWEGKHPGFRDIRYYGCTIDGKWSAHDNLGPKCKWGVLSYGLGRSAYTGQPGFVWDGGEIKGIKEEHAFYFHNIIGDVVLKDIKIKHCGRTAVQMVSRVGEGGQGRGYVLLESLDIEDVCLEQGGGGTAITCAGWHDGTINIRACKVRLGCDPNLHALVQNNITGAVVAHQGGGAEGPTKHLIIQGCDFEVGKYFPGSGSARRACVDISAVETFELVDTRIFQHPGTREALRIAPASIGKIILDSKNDITGECYYGGQKYSSYTSMLAALQGDPKVTIL